MPNTGPGHVACEFKWVEAGKPADYKGFMDKCVLRGLSPVEQATTISQANQRPTQPPVIDPQLQSAANKLFPWASQSKQRTQWLAAQVAAQMQRKNSPLPSTAVPQIRQPGSANAACQRFPNLC
jgi:hypothetical protein